MFIRKLLRKFFGMKMTEYNERYSIYNIVIIACTFFICSTLFFLPDVIPVLHQGSKQIYIPKLVGVFIPPVILVCIEFTFVLQKRINKVNTIILGIISIVSLVYYIGLIK